MQFYKYHALGNDYLLLDCTITPIPTWLKCPKCIQAVCKQHTGIGADGILVVTEASHRPYVMIYNADGSTASTSGNGMRITAQFLFDQGYIQHSNPFYIQNAHALIECQIIESESHIVTHMGKLQFIKNSAETKPVFIENPQLNTLFIEDEMIRFYSCYVGNPHCVIFRDVFSADTVKAIGHKIENHPYFPDRTNVQLVQVLGPHDIRLEIWERGSGYTLASGSSSCGAAGVACKLNFCISPVTVHMPGGTLTLRIQEDMVSVEGSAHGVFEGHLFKGIFKGLEYL